MGVVCGCADREVTLQVTSTPRARRFESARVNGSRHGQWLGARKVGVPERFTSRPGSETKRLRMVRATARRWSAWSWRPPWTWVQRSRLWAKTAQQSQAPLVGTLPDELPHARPLLQVADVELCLGTLTVEGVDCERAGVRSVRKAK